MEGTRRVSVLSMVPFLFFLIAFLSNHCVSGSSAQCAKDLGDLFDMTYPNAMEMLYMCSGRRMPVDLGNYGLCQSFHNAHMCTLKGNAFGSLPSFLGLCVPLSCDADDVKEHEEFILSLLVSPGLTISDSKVQCPNDIDHNLDSGAKGVIALLSIFGAFVVVGSLFGWYYRHVEQRKNDIYDTKNAIENESEAIHLLAASEGDLGGKTPSSVEGEGRTVEKNRVTTTTTRTTTTKNKNKTKKSIWVKLILCFDVVSNCEQIVRPPPKTPFRDLDVLNGFRVLSMLWVILGHSDSMGISSSNNADAVLSDHGVYKEWYYRIVVAAEYAVDTFFFLSGFLLVFLVFPKFRAAKGKINIVKVYVHRYLRLTPVYGVVIFIFHKLFYYLGDGPMWGGVQAGDLRSHCDSYWWTHYLYVNNFYPYKFNDQCMGWAWYLANDFQFFLISPFVMWTFLWNQFAGWSLLGLLLGGSFLATSLIVHHYDLSATIVSPRYGRSMDYIYEKPYCRISPYIVGMALAFFLIYMNRHKLSRFVRWLIYLLALSIMSLCFYGDYQNYRHTNIEDPNRSSYWSKTDDLLYLTFSRFLWSVGVGLLAYPMIVGYGKQMRKFLGHSLWLPFARLTYGAYLVHIIVIYALVMNLKHTFYYGSTMITFIFVACSVFAYLLSFVFYLLVEKPMMNAEKLLLG